MIEPKEPDFKFNLGDEIRDVITGFTGIITARSQWLSNCNTYNVQARTLHEGKPIDVKHFDEPQLELVKKTVVPEKRGTGGPERPITPTNR